MLVNRPSQAKLLFSRLEWIIVDEIHSFAENNRGVQLKSLLQRILEMTEKTPRFIGMSATMKKEDYPHIKEFFNQTRVTDVLQDKTANPLEATISYYPSTAKDPTTPSWRSMPGPRKNPCWSFPTPRPMWRKFR